MGLIKRGKIMYKHCLNCIHCKELEFHHRNIATGGWNNAYCKLKHKYFFASRMRALFCLQIKEKEVEEHGIKR